MEQSVATREDVDERTELRNRDDAARVDRTDVSRGRVEDQRDPTTSLFNRAAVLRSDGHRADDTVVVNGDVRTGLLLQGVDDLALGSDDLADLVNRDLHRDDLRRHFGDFTAGRGDGVGDELQDRQTSILRLV